MVSTYIALSILIGNVVGFGSQKGWSHEMVLIKEEIELKLLKGSAERNRLSLRAEITFRNLKYFEHCNF